MDLELKGKIAIVTGGNRGIGKAIARELAREGVNVAIDRARQGGSREDRGRDRARRATAQGAGLQRRHRRRRGGQEDGGRRGRRAFGRIDILVNCAAKPSGQAKPPTLAEITTEEFWDHMNIKVMGYLRTAREVAPHMIKQGVGPHHQRQRARPRAAPAPSSAPSATSAWRR